MQTFIPTAERIAHEKLGDETARVAVAILSFPELCTALFSSTVGKAMSAGLNRRGVEVKGLGSFFKNIFAVYIFTVRKEARGEAVEAIKQSLNELLLFPRATMAIRTADDAWLTVHGLDVGGISFDQAFLKPEDIESGEAELEKYKTNSEIMFRAAIEALTARAASEKENPDSK